MKRTVPRCFRCSIRRAPCPSICSSTIVKLGRPALCRTRSPDAAVDVSIIVPVYNQWHFTRMCLNSILETTIGTGVGFEIILADDGSSDETTQAAQSYPGLKVVKTEQNVGSCATATTRPSRRAGGTSYSSITTPSSCPAGWRAYFALWNKTTAWRSRGPSCSIPMGPFRRRALSFSTMVRPTMHWPRL